MLEFKMIKLSYLEGIKKEVHIELENFYRYISFFVIKG